MTFLVVDFDASHEALRWLSAAGRVTARLRSSGMPIEFLSRIDTVEDLLRQSHGCLRKILDSPLALPPTERSLVIIDAWIADPKWWARSTTRECTPIDDVFDVLDAPAFDRLFDILARSPDSDRLFGVLFGTTDVDALRGSLIDATDPRRVDPATARVRIELLAAAVFDEPERRPILTNASVDLARLKTRRAELRQLLGELSAPWQLHFTGLAHLWGGSPEDGIELLRRIAANNEAARELIAGLDAATRRAFLDLPTDHESRMRRIDDIAFSIGATAAVFENELIEDAERRSAARRSALAVPAYLPLGLSWTASLTLSVASGIIGARLDEGDSVRETAREADHALRERLTRVATRGVLDSAIANHMIDPHDDDLPTDVRIEMMHARDSILDAGDEGRRFAD